jgi:hypothetical protein
MARHKNSTALFEVITAGKTADRRPAAAAAAALRTPKWWFKGKHGSESAAPVSEPLDPNDPTLNVTPARFQTRVAVTPVVEEPASSLSPQAPPQHAFETITPTADQPASPTTLAVAPRPPMSLGHPSRSGMQLTIDRQRQEVTLQMRFTTAIISSFAAVVVLCLAYIVGRHVSEGPARASAGNVSTAQVKKGAVQSSALDLSNGKAGTARDPSLAASRSPQDPGVFSDAQVLPDGTARRTTNMNYVVIQNYPPEMQKTAYDVRDFFNRSGVPCTVEKVARESGHANWLSVIGIRGFQRKFTDSPEYLTYLQDIKTLSERFPNKGAFVKLRPHPYKWD